MENTENAVRNKGLAALNISLLKLQKRIAEWLNDKCRNLPARTLMVMLIIFCSCSATLLIMLIMGKL